MLNPNLTELEQNLAAGQIACPNCRALQPRDGLAALSTISCPSCGKPFLVGSQVGKYYLQETVEGDEKGLFRALSPEDRDALPVVVKVIPTEAKGDLEAIRELWTEAQVGALLNDTDFVVGCLDHGVSNGFYYIVCPDVVGEPLDHYVARTGKLPVSHAITLTLHLLAGLQHLYRVGFLYRNFLPEKLLVTPAGYGVLAHLGHCRAIADAAEPPPYPAAEPPSQFFAPERLLNQGETLTSELYSLGMVLFYALTGTNYFTDDELADLTARGFRGKRPGNPQLATLPTSLSILLDSMLRFNRAERPQNCTEVADSLKAILTELEDD